MLPKRVKQAPHFVRAERKGLPFNPHKEMLKQFEVAKRIVNQWPIFSPVEDTNSIEKAEEILDLFSECHSWMEENNMNVMVRNNRPHPLSRRDQYEVLIVKDGEIYAS